MTEATSDTGPSTHVQQITGFIDDASNQAASLPHLKEPQSSVIADSMESRVHTLIDVLSRPVKVASGEWSDTNPNNSTLETLSFPQALFDASPNIVEKLNYFAFFRADVCIRIINNANPFQLGKLIGNFTPFVEYTGDRIVATQFPSSYTAYPHTISDASVGNTTDLCIPYVAPYSSYRLTDKIGNIGTFYLRVLNQLRDGNCSYTVYAWFTNISVDLPTGKENTLTSISQTIKKLRDTHKLHGDKVLAKVDKRLSNFEGQVAGESEQKSGGIISSTLHTISDVGSALTAVPLLADVAGPVAWVSKQLAGVAEFFGFSKPLDQSNLQKYENVPGWGYTHATGTDSGVILSTSHENSIELRGDVFGSNVDEMAIPWIVAHKCLVDRFAMDTNSAIGSELFSFPVTPGWCRFGNAEYEPTITAYIASMARYWRGGIKYKIQAAKTAYHSGRLRIIYIPAATDSSIDSADQAYNWVFDLRTSSEIEFTIPYNNILEWQLCGVTDELNSPFSTGVVRIEVLNELRAPTTVAQDLIFNIWLSGAEDLQFSVFDITRYVPSITVPSFEGQTLGATQDMGFNDMSNKPPMFCMEPTDKINPCKLAIGEMITNLRQITRRFGLVTKQNVPSNTLLRSFPAYTFGNAFVPGDNLGQYYISPVDYISWIYKFFRGGSRFKAFYDGTTLDGGVQEACLAVGAPETSYDSVDTAFFEQYFDAAGSYQHRVFTNQNPVLEITTPFYSQTPIRPIQAPGENEIPLLDNLCVYYRLRRYNPPAGSLQSTRLEVYKAASDDFSFGWLVGPPYLVPRTNTVTLDFTLLTLAQYSEPTYQLVSGNYSTKLPLRSGRYRILALGANGTETIPIVFSNGTQQLPATNFTLLYQRDIDQLDLTNDNVPLPQGATFDSAGSLVAVQLLGQQTAELELI